ncbi:dynein light chain roadblock-type 2-like [Phyllopteryx taeniolatus]|uniref:dynein light chain roadblock-type 2-like n=1 Tax=Phyllopteryx taeniolatus TaxID=161469 RepID=UPI002ACE6EE6|nr:dynein light chain roadblock-type 2-like isoform X2 [Phycodurus eques]XP_061628549.1 dynein light chain roadblock-type 2-like [Phyllopteryx taeniolatus]
MAEVEETLQRIEAHGSVIGTIVANADGIPVRSTFDISKAGKYVEVLRHLTALARSTVRDVDPQDDLVVMRISTKNQEIMVAPENSYLLILIQRYERYART